MRDELMKIERRLWTNDPEFYEASYLPEAVLIFPEVGRIDRTVAVEAIRGENRRGRHWAEVAFDDVATLPLGDDTVLLTYFATARWNDEANPGRAVCATLYINLDGRWRVAFHQQTLA